MSWKRCGVWGVGANALIEWREFAVRLRVWRSFGLQL